MMERIGTEIVKQTLYKLIIPFAIIFAIGFILGDWLF